MTRDSIDILAALAALVLTEPEKVPVAQFSQQPASSFTAEDITRIMRADRDYYTEVDNTFDTLERLEIEQLVSSSGEDMRSARWSITATGLYKVLCR